MVVVVVMLVVAAMVVIVMGPGAVIHPKHLIRKPLIRNRWSGRPFLIRFCWKKLRVWSLRVRLSYSNGKGTVKDKKFVQTEA